MKVLLFMPDIDQSSGGTTTWLRTLAEELRLVTELHIATYQSEHPVIINNSTIHYLHHSVFRGLKKEWLNLLNHVNPDLIHINTCWLPACAFLQKWAQDANYNIVLSPHGMLEPWIVQRNYWTKKLPALLLYQKTAVKNANLIHATAESEKSNLLKLGWNEKVYVVSNGIDVQNIRLKEDWTVKKKILFLSRVHPKKGIEILLQVIAILKDSLIGYNVIIAGEGDAMYFDSLGQKVRELGIGQLIQFVGGVYGDDKWKYYQEADFFVLPTYSENFGLVIAEALASGTPVITTHGTPWKDLEEYDCGSWIPLEVQALTETIVHYIGLSDLELRNKGKLGRQLIEDKYGNQKMAQKIKQLYEWVLDKGEKPEFVD
jgi:glycosyltransferase involved in cell wall biosynthesis